MLKSRIMGSLLLAGVAYAAPVLSWVSPYGYSSAKSALETQTVLLQNMTHVSLQLWNPAPDGGLIYASMDGVDDATDTHVQDIVNIVKPKGIKSWLCVYNNSELKPGWNWTLVQGVINDVAKRAKFVDALVAEVKRLNLDGVDLDLEGDAYDDLPSAQQKTDKANYLLLVKELRAKLPADKEINVDSFHYLYNAPSQSWWKELLANGATYIVSMGYQDLGVSGTCNPTGTWCTYVDQTKAIGAGNENRLIIGAPNTATWKSSAADVHMKGLAALAGPGVGIWELYQINSAWNGTKVGPNLSQIKAAPSYVLPSSSSTGSSSSAVSSSSSANSAVLLGQQVQIQYSRQNLQIESPSAIELSLINAQGAQVLNASGRGVMNLSLAALPVGVYQLDYKIGSSSMTRTIVIK